MTNQKLSQVGPRADLTEIRQKDHERGTEGPSGQSYTNPQFYYKLRVAMTKAMEWLKANAPGFNLISKDEQNALADFSLLWSLFESRVLNTKGNVTNICDAVEAWHSAGTLDAAAFEEELAYFRKRYYADGDFTYHFDHLHFRKPDREALVRAVIDGSNDDPRSRVAAVLIIVFRYRNNLFHGVKWQYKLEGQIGNFTAANNILMKMLERHGALADG